MTTALLSSIISPVHKLAIEKSVDVSVDERNSIRAGDYPVDAWFHIQGIVKVCEDNEAKQPNKVDWTGLFALALSKLNGVTCEALVEEFLNKPGVETDDIKKRAQKLIDKIKGETKQPRKGGVKFNGIIEEATGEIIYPDNKITCVQVGDQFAKSKKA